MRLSRLFLLAGVVGTALLAGGCRIHHHQSSAADVDPAGWREAVEFCLPNADTLTLRDLFLFVRHDERFTEDTLTVRIALRSPDSLRHEELYPLVIQRHATAAALSSETQIAFRRRVRFGHEGDYYLTITPLRPARGIRAIGVNIVKSN